MTTPDTPPPQSPIDASPPEAAEPAAVVSPEVSAPPAVVEPVSNGHHASDHLEGSSDAAPAAPAGEPAGDAAPPQQADGQGEHGERKRRRRRRKRKPGASAAGETAPHEEGEEAAVDGPAEEGATTEGAGHAPGSPERQAPKKKKEKKPQPRERPPVNAGDIVFGKILAITDEAIIVDIPGKAHAIFDRREMLLPDDDDSPPKPRVHAEAAPVEAPAEPGEPPAAAEASSEEAVVDGTTTTTATATPTPTPTTTTTTTATATDELAADPEPPKEPKVPRVILEVGADFIAVVHNDGARGGLVVLTHHPNRAEKAKAAVEKAFNEKTIVEGLVTGVIKGGIEVDIDGLRAFAPGSHVDLRLGTDLSHLVAERLPFVVTQYAKRGRDLVLSRRAMLEEEAQKARSDALTRLKVGEEIDGVVRSVVPFGAFVDVGGIEGLVPLQEMSHNRADGPNQVFKAGEPTRVKVLKIDERGKVWLSHKATIPDPWQQVAQKYAVGTRHSAKVARIQPFGAFVELEAGVDGLIHTQDLSIARIESPSDVVKVDDPIEVVVAHVDPSSHKIGLHPALKGDAANEAPQRVQPHKPVKAKVVTIESGGLVVRILGVTGRNARGYVTAAGTGTPRGTELRKVFKVGQEVEGKVIEIDPRRGEIKLSIKALSEDQERNAYQQYRQQLKAEARFTFGDLLAKKK
ncbi:MAG: S1 RNA-binding domain-containing protein [Polyangiaceae bacterium]